MSQASPSTATSANTMSLVERLENVYRNFCAFGDRTGPALMDGAKFAKFARDCKLLDRSLTATEVDLIFAKSKNKNERKINFDQFTEALFLLSQKKYGPDSGDDGYGRLIEQVLSSAGPTANATEAQTTGIFDKLTDTSQYTGVQKLRFDDHGGASTVKRRSLDGKTPETKSSETKATSASSATPPAHGTSPGTSSGTSRTRARSSSSGSANPRRLSLEGKVPESLEGDMSNLSVNANSAAGTESKAGETAHIDPSADPIAYLQQVFNTFCAFGDRSGVAMMDNAKFAKFARDCNVISGKKLTTTDIDLIFARVKPKNERKLSFQNFVAALRLCAEKKYDSMSADQAFQALVSDIATANGPVLSGTSAQTQGIFDRLTDVNLYTGAHKNRFNSDGTGRGLNGRDSVAKGGSAAHTPLHPNDAIHDLSQITRSNLR